MANSAEIPIIDLGGDRDEVAKQLVHAAEAHGFIYIKNRGDNIAPADIDGAFGLVRMMLRSYELLYCSLHVSSLGRSSTPRSRKRKLAASSRITEAWEQTYSL